MSVAAVGESVSFLPDKPSPKAPPPQTVSFRPTSEQDAYLKGLLAKGWAPGDLMKHIVGFYMHVEKRLADDMSELERFAVEQKIAATADNRDPEDLRWVAEAVARLVELGLKHSKNDKKR